MSRLPAFSSFTTYENEGKRRKQRAQRKQTQTNLFPPSPPPDDNLLPPPPPDPEPEEKIVAPIIRENKIVTHITIPDPDAGIKDVTFNKKISTMGNTDPISSVYGLFKPSITDSDRWQAFTRDELVNKAVWKKAGSCINKGWSLKLTTVEDDNSADFPKIVEQLFRETNLNLNLKMALLKGFIYGVGWLGINFEDKGELANPPKNAKDISSFQTIDNDAIKVRPEYVDTRPNSLTYGQPLAYDIKYDTVIGYSSDDVKINALRILRVVPLPIDDSLKGASMIDPIFNKWIIKARMDFDIGDTYFRMSKPLPEFTTPPDKAAYDQMVTDFGDDGILSSKVWIHKYAVDPLTKEPLFSLKLHGFDGEVLSPKDFYDVTVDPMLAGLGVPKVLITGATGSAQGNDVNLETFYSEIADIQNSILTPLIRDIIQRCFESGVLKALGWKQDVPDYTIIWNPIYELTAKEGAQVDLMRAKVDDLRIKEGVKDINEVRSGIGLPPKDQTQLEEFYARQKPVGKPTGPGDDDDASDKVPFDTHNRGGS